MKIAFLVHVGTVLTMKTLTLFALYALTIVKRLE